MDFSDSHASLFLVYRKYKALPEQGSITYSSLVDVIEVGLHSPHSKSKGCDIVFKFKFSFEHFCLLQQFSFELFFS